MKLNRSPRRGFFLLTAVMIVAYAAWALVNLRNLRDPRTTSRAVNSSKLTSYYGLGAPTLASYCPPGRGRRGSAGSSCNSGGCDAGGQGFVDYGYVPAGYSTGYTSGNCPNGQCSTNTGYYWVDSSDKTHVGLYLNNQQIGDFMYVGEAAGRYYSLNNGQWLETTPPVSLPDAAQRLQEVMRIQAVGQKSQAPVTPSLAPKPTTAPGVGGPLTPGRTTMLDPAADANATMAQQIAELRSLVMEMKKGQQTPTGGKIPRTGDQGPPIIEDATPVMQTMPSKTGGKDDVMPPTGLNREELAKDKQNPGITINGREKVSYETADARLKSNGWAGPGAGELIDWKTKGSLTVVGTLEEIDRAKQIINEACPGGLDNVVFRDGYVRGHPLTNELLAAVGFPTDEGSPAIFLQAPNGTMLRRLTSTTGLRDLVCQLRKPSSNYDRARDPVGPPPTLASSAEEIIPIVGSLLGLVILVTLMVAFVKMSTASNSQTPRSPF